MGGWVLTAAAAGFWLGIFAAGSAAVLRGTAEAVLLMAGGLAWLAALALGGWATGESPSAPARRHAAAFVAFLALGAGWGSLRFQEVSASPLARLAGRSVELTGTMTTDPVSGPLGWTATIDVATVAPGLAGWPDEVAVHDPVWAEGRGPPPRLEAGDRVAAAGLLEEPGGSFGLYLRHRGYPAELSLSYVHFAGRPVNPLMRGADALRGALRASLARVFPAREAGLLMGLTLGDTSRLDPIVAERFRATGLTHLLAVSGENVAMFVAPILGLAGLLHLGPRAKFAVGLLAVVFFVLLTRAEPSVLRAAAMSGLTLLGVFLGRPRSPPAVMGAAILLLLAVNPTLVYAIGFQLSVGATAGIALLANPLAERLRWLPRSLALAAGTTIGAQAGVTPLLLHDFGAVPTVTIAANLLAFPAVGPGMLLGLLAAAAGVVSTAAGSLIAWADRIPLGYLEGLAGRLARWPLPSITSSVGHPWTLLVGFAVVGMAVRWVRSGMRLSRRGILTLGVAAALFTSASAVGAGPPRSLTVTFFDVGQGDAALIRSPAGATILIDGGPDPEQVATKLAALGVRRLDLMVATHPHADHVAGLPAVLARYPVGLIVDPGCFGDSPFYAGFLRAVAASGDPVRHPRPGDILRIGDVRVEILGPGHCFNGTDSDPNNDSLVLRVSVGSDTVMFPGDAEQPAQTEVLRDEGPFLHATVLKVPHHGGATSLDEFFTAVGASLAVVSVGPNTYGHPVPAVLRELATDGMRVFRTDRAGDVTVTFEAGGGVSVQSTGHG
jgi:competence protein ComEC